MVELRRIYEGLRDEGLSIGIPMTFLEMGVGLDYTDEDLISELMKAAKYKGEWVCILGDDTLKVGMGTLVQGLAKCLFHIEMEADGQSKDPGWFQYVDRWVVDFNPISRFNYNGMRTNDCVRFVLKDGVDLSELKEAFHSLRHCQAVKYLKIIDRKVWDEHERDLKDIVKQQDRNRIYLRC